MCGQLKPGKRKIQKKEEVVNLILITKEAKEAKSARGGRLGGDCFTRLSANLNIYINLMILFTW